MTLSEFLSRPEIKNAWVNFENAKVYLRRRAWWDGSTTYIDIANLTSDRQFHGTGQFKRLVQSIADAVDDPHVMFKVENVTNKHLERHLQRRGWKLLDQDSQSWPGWPSSYKKPARECKNYCTTG